MSAPLDRDIARTDIVRRPTLSATDGPVEETGSRPPSKAHHAKDLVQAKQEAPEDSIGSSTAKYTHIAFAIIVICFLLIVLMAFRFDLHQDFDNFLKFCSHIFSIITGVLGYLFGLKNSKD